MSPKKRILIVEDDEFLRQIYTDTLTAEGYELGTAKDGQEALDALIQGGWDLVLLDVILPRLTGVDLLKKLRTTTVQKPNGKIIVASNLDEGEEFREAKALS